MKLAGKDSGRRSGVEGPEPKIMRIFGWMKLWLGRTAEEHLHGRRQEIWQ
jgi:hypothetical protein